MANDPRQAPFSIVGSTSTDANGKPTALATVDGVVYTCSGDSASGAFQNLAEQLLMVAWCDPACKLTVSPNVIGDIIQAV